MLTPALPWSPWQFFGEEMFPNTHSNFHIYLLHSRTTWGCFLSSYFLFPESTAWPHLAPASCHRAGEKLLLSSSINSPSSLSPCSSDLCFHLKLFYYQSLYPFVPTTTKAQGGTTQEKAKPTNLCNWDVLWETKGVLKEKYLRKSPCQNPSQDHSPPRTL